MSRTGIAAVTLGQAALLAGTFYVPGLGSVWWHHVASLALVLAAAAALAGRMRSRRFLGIGVLASSALAAVSGFYLLYWKEAIRVDGYQDWGVFWHVLWSWAAAGFFWQHTWVNRIALGHFVRRNLRAVGPATLHIGLYFLTAAALVVTWGPAKAAFSNENYVPLSLWTWIAATAVAYAGWLLLRRRDHAAQKRIRGAVDLGLVPVAAVAILSGLPLLFLDGVMERTGLKYASKFWHVWPSVVFTVLVTIHAVQLWTGLRAHWRRTAGDLPADPHAPGTRDKASAVPGKTGP